MAANLQQNGEGSQVTSAFLVSRAEAQTLRHAELGSLSLQHTWKPKSKSSTGGISEKASALSHLWEMSRAAAPKALILRHSLGPQKGLKSAGAIPPALLILLQEAMDGAFRAFFVLAEHPCPPQSSDSPPHRPANAWAR